MRLSVKLSPGFYIIILRSNRPIPSTVVLDSSGELVSYVNETRNITISGTRAYRVLLRIIDVSYSRVRIKTEKNFYDRPSSAMIFGGPGGGRVAYTKTTWS